MFRFLHQRCNPTHPMSHTTTANVVLPLNGPTALESSMKLCMGSIASASRVNSPNTAHPTPAASTAAAAGPLWKVLEDLAATSLSADFLSLKVASSAYTVLS